MDLELHEHESLFNAMRKDSPFAVEKGWQVISGGDMEAEHLSDTGGPSAQAAAFARRALEIFPSVFGSSKGTLHASSWVS